MRSTYEELANRAIDILKNGNNYRVIIVVIGTPGSGKSTILKEVCEIINSRFQDVPVIEDEGNGPNLDGISKFIDTIPNEKLINNLESDDFKLYKRQIEDDLIEIYGKGAEDTKISVKNTYEKGKYATVVPMDGFHLSREQLSQFKDPETAIFRRGSPFTFDNVNLITLTNILKLSTNYQLPRQDLNMMTSSLPTIEIPSFSHHLKDPVPNEIKISGNSRVLIMEGLYLLLNDKNWDSIAKLLQHSSLKDKTLFINTKTGEVNEVPITTDNGIEFWKIHINADKNAERVAKRHLLSGIVDSLLKGEERFRLNDAINGELLLQNSAPCDLNIYSIDDAIKS